MAKRKKKNAAGDVHLIVAKDAEVVIEHHPEDWLAFVLFWSLAFIVFLQFFTRYVLNDSLAWTEEIARYALIWVVFIGGAMVTRRNTHTAVERDEAGPAPLCAAGFCRFRQTRLYRPACLPVMDDHGADGNPTHDRVRPADELCLFRCRPRLFPDVLPPGAKRLAQRQGRLAPA